MVKYKIFYFLYSFNEYIKLNPKDYWGWSFKGNLLKELKRYDEAIDWLNTKYFIYI